MGRRPAVLSGGGPQESRFVRYGDPGIGLGLERSGSISMNFGRWWRWGKLCSSLRTGEEIEGVARRLREKICRVGGMTRDGRVRRN